MDVSISDWQPGRVCTPQELCGRFSLPKEEVNAYQGCMRIYRRGGVIIQEGEQDRTLFLLRAGQVSVYKHTGPRQRELLGDIEAVNIFGEMSLFNDEPRSATVIAQSDEVLVYAIGRLDLHVLLSHPRWTEMLITRLCKNLSATNQQVVAAAQALAQAKADHLRSIEEASRQMEEVGRVLGVLAAFQQAILERAIVGSRGWLLLRALNQITAWLVKRRLGNVATIPTSPDLALVEEALASVRSAEFKSVARELRESFPSLATPADRAAGGEWLPTGD